MVYAISRFLFYILLKILFNLKVYGRENLPGRGPFILAANHESYLDPPIVGIACNTAQVNFMAKSDFFSSKFGWWFRAVNCISLDMGKADFRAIKEALRRLKKGRTIAIFPEGQRSMDGKTGQPQPGIGLLASKSKIPVIPVFINGSGKALGVGSRAIKRTPISAKIGRPVNIKSIKKHGLNKKLLYKSIGNEIMRSIVNLKG